MKELIVFLHGMWGSDFDFRNFDQAVKEHLQEKTVTLRIKGNRNRTTHGVKAGAQIGNFVWQQLQKRKYDNCSV